MAHPYLSIVIPTLNEEGNIEETIRETKKVLKGYSYELIVVDGYSSDKTVRIAKRMGAKIMYDRVGKGSALIKGFGSSKGDIVISMDADLSNRPNELRLLIAGIEAGYDVCMGSRFLTGGGSDDMPLIRRAGNRFFLSLVNLFFGASYSDLCYGYRSFSKETVKRLKLDEVGFGIETEINIKCRKLGLKALEVPSYEKKRGGGVGKLHTFRDGYGILKVIVRNVLEN
jgi:glycosyltransferase involved in cell wall biosynthesis